GGEELNREGYEAIGDDVLEPHRVDGDSMNQVTDTASIVEAQRQSLKLHVEVAAQPPHHALAEQLREVLLAEGQHVAQEQGADHEPRRHGEQRRAIPTSE